MPRQGRRVRPIWAGRASCRAATFVVVFGGRFLARDAEALAPFPQTLSADAELARELGFAHVVLVLQHEALEVLFQRKVFGRVFGAGGRFAPLMVRVSRFEFGT